MALYSHSPLIAREMFHAMAVVLGEVSRLFSCPKSRSLANPGGFLSSIKWGLLGKQWEVEKFVSLERGDDDNGTRFSSGAHAGRNAPSSSSSPAPSRQSPPGRTAATLSLLHHTHFPNSSQRQLHRFGLNLPVKRRIAREDFLGSARSAMVLQGSLEASLAPPPRL